MQRTKTSGRKASTGKKIFISHSSDDKVIVDTFIDLILQGGLSIKIDEIFCISTDGSKIKSGEDWRNAIKDSLTSAKINFLIITPNYKESEVCLNEMGAAWVSNAKVLPMIIEPINYESVGIIQQPKQIEKLLDEKSLDRIRDLLQEELEIPTTRIKSDRWTAKKKEFITVIAKYLEENQFRVPVDRKTFEEILQESGDLQKTVESLIDEKSDLKKYIQELENIKDKKEVNRVKKKLYPSDQFQDFVELCEKVQEALSRFSPIIIGIVFKSYTGKDGITIYWEGYKDVLDDALASDYINKDLEADFYTTNMMSNINSYLNKVDSFLEGDLTEEFISGYCEKYGAPMKIENKIFWEEVLGVSVSFS